VTWLKIARELREKLVEPNGRCVLCGEKLYTIEDRCGYKKLWKVYMHFKLKHPHVFNYFV